MNSKTQHFLIHIIGCIAFLSFPIISSPDFDYNLKDLFKITPFKQSFLSQILLLIFFYFNYYYLIPKFYLNQKKVIYIVLLFVCLILFLGLPHLLFPSDFNKMHHFDNHHFYKRRNSPPFNFGGIISFGLMLCLSFLIRLNQHIKEIKTENLSAEIASLKAQINPHFLFNTLNSLYALTIIKSNEAPKAVLKLSSIMRYVVTESTQNFVSLEKEINYIKDYIELQKFRITDNVSLKFSIEGNPTDKTIAPLLLIPFIENAFKYGINPDEKSEVIIILIINENQLELDVKNRIVTNVVSEEYKTEKGIEITKKRLDYLYPNKHVLSINEEEKIYHVNLELNLS